MNELKRFVFRIQPPPVINTIPNTKKMGYSKQNDIINRTNTGTGHNTSITTVGNSLK